MCRRSVIGVFVPLARVLGSSNFDDFILVYYSNKDVQRDIQILQYKDSERPEIALDLWPQEQEFLPQLPLTEEGSSIHSLELEVRSAFTSMYRLTSDSSKVILYRQVCPGSHRWDESLTDYWFLKYLRPTGIVPVVHGISRLLDVSVVQEAHPWGMFKLRDIRKCSRGSTTAHIRYILMDRAPGLALGARIHHQDRLDVLSATRLLRSIVRALEKIHALNVVHGDLHIDNIIVAEDYSVKLIDFERGRIFNPTELSSIAKPSCFGNGVQDSHLETASWRTYWEAQYCPGSIRDDMYKALLIFGGLLFGQAYIDFQESISDTEHATQEQASTMRTIWALHRRFSDTVFNIDTTGIENLPEACSRKFDVANVLPRVSESVHVLVRDKLEAIVRIVLDLDLGDRPEYNAVYSLLSEIESAVVEHK